MDAPKGKSSAQERVFTPVIDQHASWIAVNPVQGCPKHCAYCFLNERFQTGTDGGDQRGHEQPADMPGLVKRVRTRPRVRRVVVAGPRAAHPVELALAQPRGEPGHRHLPVSPVMRHGVDGQRRGGRQRADPAARASPPLATAAALTVVSMATGRAHARRPARPGSPLAAA